MRDAKKRDILTEKRECTKKPGIFLPCNIAVIKY